MRKTDNNNGFESLVVKMHSRAEAAQLLGISIPTLDRRLAAGDLEHYKDGSRVLIDTAQIEEYKAKHRRSRRAIAA